MTILMQRFCLCVEYDGTFFSGWQRQFKQIKTVQNVLEDAIFKLTQINARIMGAGRTDHGVHATAQMAHVDLPRHWTPHQIQHGINFYIKKEAVIVRAVYSVSHAFHARFSAQARMYTYVIFNRSSRPVLENKRGWWLARPLNILSLQTVANIFIGQHDFRYFCGQHDVKQPLMRTIDQCNVEIHNLDDRLGKTILIHIRARSFVYHQVRLMVGFMKSVAYDFCTIHHLHHLLCGQRPAEHLKWDSAPPEGLFLTGVIYPPCFGIKAHSA